MGLRPCRASAGEKTDSEHVLRPHLEACAWGLHFLTRPSNQVLVCSTRVPWGAVPLGGTGNLEGAQRQSYEISAVCFSRTLKHAQTRQHSDAQTHRVCDLGQWISIQVRWVLYNTLSHSLSRNMVQVKSAQQSRFYHENVELDLNINHDGKKTTSALSYVRLHLLMVISTWLV